RHGQPAGQFRPGAVGRAACPQDPLLPWHPPAARARPAPARSAAGFLHRAARTGHGRARARNQPRCQMSSASLLRTLLLSLTLGLALASCKTLPDVDPSPTGKTTPTVETTRGTLAPHQASNLVSKRWANASADLKSLAVMEEQATGEPLIAGNKVGLLFDGPATMRAMMDAARAATSSINLETYIFDQDQVGREFADLLIEKQRQGVQVNV